MKGDPLLELDDVTIKYETNAGSLVAVSDTSLTVRNGEYFGLVGESGCGKSTLVKAILGVLDPNGSITSGSVRYKGRPIHEMSQEELSKEIRWKEISMIPQSSMNSLDPIERLSETAVEVGRTHTDYSRAEILERFREMFDIVGLSPDRIDDYPHEFSGGMRQRSLIALALFLEPSLVIADEPTTALDVIMEDQILNYLDEIRDQTSMMMITHDISLIFENCDRLAIMHGGQVAEVGSATDVYDTPHHPYSILLQEAFPDIRYPKRELETIEGAPPQLYGEVDSCSFADRCPWAVEECKESVPPLEAVDEGSDAEHRASCFRKGEDLYEEAGDR